jgi:tripartite ATP-independent transporter DctM subunit
MIIYGALTNTSIGALFLAGFIPGLLMAAMFMAAIIIASVLNPAVGGAGEPVAPMAERLARLKDLLPPLAIFITVMGSIYLGWATPTEAAGVGVVAALLLVGLAGRLSVPMLVQCMLTTVSITAMTLLILVAAFYLNFIVGVLGIPAQVSAFMAGVDLHPFVMILLLVALYVFLGCFLDSLAMMIATIPIVFPIVTHLGYDAVWFGIFLVIMCEIALITPPVGMNLYVVQGVRGRGTISDVVAGTMPFLACMFLMVALLTLFPGIVSLLPSLLS